MNALKIFGILNTREFKTKLIFCPKIGPKRTLEANHVK